MDSTQSIQFMDLGKQVTRQLRKEIVAGRLAPGSRLVETALSERFDVSRGPIRNALRELEAEGLVHSSRRGTYVVGLSADDVGELYSLRGALESFAFSVVATADDVDWEPFEACVKAMADAADKSDAEAFAHADLRFHRCFYVAADHRRLLLVWNQMEPTFQALLEFTNAQDRDLHPALESHRELLRDVRSNQLTSALDELSAHLAGSQARMVDARRALIEQASDSRS